MKDGKVIKAGEYLTATQLKQIVVDDNIDVPIYMNISEGRYIEYTNNYFNNMYKKR